MSNHKNARLTAFSRAAMIHRILFGGWTAERAATVYAISVRTVRKWLKRYHEEGLAGLENRSSKPRTFGTAYVAGWQAVICSLRRCRMTGAEIATQLRQPRSTVASLLRRIGLGRRRCLIPSGLSGSMSARSLVTWPTWISRSWRVSTSPATV